ncbi:unnamed protein product [Phytophthora lilii]|uniref:Unnamed protein product n=1 Tax=Phytophthora lilii TaxID=2077276 RepID=A0A9W6TF65_9STRA|nr:unnamed protein product [Phytophthora lilii]
MNTTNDGHQRGGRESSDSDDGDILSSYVDVDDFTPQEHRAWLRANREDKFRAMHIVALIEGVERVLCSLRFYKETGLFCATPGFSSPIVEPENDPDLLVKGPKLTTYHVSTPSGALYEYVLDNAHDLLPFASAEDQRLSRDIRLQEEKRDMADVIRWQQYGISINSNNAQRKMMLSIEVVAVLNPQTTDLISVEYELQLPERTGYPKWKMQADHRTRGKTPLSLPQRSAYPDCAMSASFGWLQHFNLKLVMDEVCLTESKVSEEEKVVAAPILHVSVYSRDCWRRRRTQGHGEIKLQGSSGFYDFDVPIRKPINSIRDQMEELFLGEDESDADEFQITSWTHEREINTDESPISTMITSRLGQKSESMGSAVRIRYSIVDLQPSKHSGGVNSERIVPKSITTPMTNAQVVKRSVQEILQSVKLEKRLASITDTRIQAALRSLPQNGVAAATESLIDKSALS